MFTLNYPLLIEHTREARHFMNMLNARAAESIGAPKSLNQEIF